ncbi:MAG: DNA polymerase [Lysobacter sp.]
MDKLHHDFETFSKCDLKKHGLARYARHESTEVMFLWFAFNDEEPEVWFPATEPMPKRLRKALLDPNVLKCAHNAQFERAIWKHVVGVDIPVEQFYCSQAHAFWLSLPGDLDTLSTVLRLDDKTAKMKEGKSLIKFFCGPRKPTKTKQYLRNTAETDPAKWALFVEYGRRDVIAERAACRKLSPYAMSKFERELWFIDQHINERGVPFDKPFVQTALKVIAKEKARLIGEMKGITGLSNPASGAQLLPWLRERGYPFTNLKSKSIRKAREDWDWNMTDEANDVLALHAEAARSSVTKLQKMLDIEVDGMLCYTMQFAGAGRTARWAGRAVQVQNLPRPLRELEEQWALLEARAAIENEDMAWLRLLTPSPMGAIASCIRTAIKAPAGYEFATCDLASIESVVIGWLSNCEKLIEVFVKNLDVYKVFASKMYKVDYEKVEKWMRQHAKPGVLGAGFRLSGGIEVGEYPEVTKTGLWGYAENMGIEMTQKDSTAVVSFFRSEYEEIVELWYELERAVTKVMQTKEPVRVGPVIMDVKGPFLRMRLPSGRYLHYLRPQISWKKIKVGVDKKTGKPKFKSKKGFSYEGYNTKKKWARIDSHGGKIVENLVQAIARELLAAGLVKVWKAGLDVRMHVHDEIVALVKRKLSDISAATLEEQMVEKPEWWGERVPIRAKAEIVECYQK